MNIKTLTAIMIIAFAFFFGGCKQNPYDEAVEYIDQLSEEVMSATNETEYDAAYNKIICLNASEKMTNLKNLSSEQKKTILTKATDLTGKSLAVKAILYVMPKDITPTSEDMKKLADECIQNKLNVLVAPYGDVRALVHEYYHIAN